MEKRESWVTFIFGITVSAILFFLLGDSLKKNADFPVEFPGLENISIEQVNEDSKSAENEKKHQENGKVKFVVDGDTLVMEDGSKIRMLGIDTPEIGEYLYEEATEHLKSLIDQKEVTLTKDVSETDRYGRLLRHVYVGDQWINAQMIGEGYAKMVTFPPDVQHTKKFKALQQEAIAKKKGLWQNEDRK